MYCTSVFSKYKYAIESKGKYVYNIGHEKNIKCGRGGDLVL